MLRKNTFVIKQLQCKYQEGKKDIQFIQQEIVLYVEYAQPLFSFLFLPLGRILTI